LKRFDCREEQLRNDDHTGRYDGIEGDNAGSR
jgi:hypothetical protein